MSDVLPLTPSDWPEETKRPIGPVFPRREDPDSWKTDPAESAPAVPENSKLANQSIKDLESRYGVRIEVQEGDRERLSEHALLYVRGSGLAVEEFFNDLTTLIR